MIQSGKSKPTTRWLSAKQMSTFQEDRKAREIEAYLPFRNLWNADDDMWLEKRSTNWERAFHDSDVDCHTLAQKNFYIFGEEPPALSDDGEKIFFDFVHRTAFTPFLTSDHVRRYWQATLDLNTAGAQQKHGKFRYVGEELDLFPERDAIVELVSKTMYSPEYFACPANSRTPNPNKLSTILPRDFVVGYSGVSSYYSQKNRHELDYRCFSFEYFLLALRYCEEKTPLTSKRHIEALPNMYKCLLALDDPALNQPRLDLKNKLISAAEADNAPAILRDAFKAAL